MTPKQNLFDLKFFSMNYQGCLIYKNGKTYTWNKKSFESLGAVVVAIEEAHAALLRSIKN